VNQRPDCADVVLRLFEYVDHEAEEADARVIQQHLDECGSCLREYERDVLLKALVRRACGSELAPETLRTQILARITTSVTVTRRTEV
jgi:mycothiol system anti-sigma-R factor